jgi:hypothetical protein
MPSRRRGCGLAVNHQHLQLRERLGTTAHHHWHDPGADCASCGAVPGQRVRRPERSALGGRAATPLWFRTPLQVFWIAMLWVTSLSRPAVDRLKRSGRGSSRLDATDTSLT